MTTLQTRLRQVRELEAEAARLGLDVPPIGQGRDHIDVAVVGEIKRGKSTFLNALMRSKVFPSRALVCTSAVTVLVDAPAPAITIRYKDPEKRPTEHRDVPTGSDVFDVMMSLVAKVIKRKDGPQGNPNTADIDEVEIGYPNRFATEGIRLVDTPGVNDPDTWREEITYRYLGRADAAIMLLDPQQPLSSSEVSFLRDKVQARVKHQLLFVLNKADQVSPADLEKSLQRIRKELMAWVDDPRVYPVAAKPALDAYLAGTPVDDGFIAFENDLDADLRRGRAGSLLVSRVDLIVDAAARKEAILRARMTTLDQEQGQAHADLDRMERLLAEKGRELQILDRSMRSWLEGQAHRVAEGLRGQVARCRAGLSTNPNGLRAGLDQLPRDLVTALEDASEQLSQGLSAQFGDQARRGAGELRAARITIGSLQLSQFSHASSADVSESGWGAGGGAAAGMLFGGPIGALIGGLIGGLLGSHAQGQRQQLEQQRLITAAHAYLTELEQTVRARAGDLTRGVGTATIPLLRRPLETAIADETAGVQASRRDLAQSGAERATIRRNLEAERARIAAFHERCTALKRELLHV